MDGHAPLAPSSAHRWAACPGSVELSRLAKGRPSGIAAQRGTLMHEYCARILLDKSTLDLEGLSREEHDTVDVYVAYVQALIDVDDPDMAFGVEARVHVPDIHPDCWGTADTWAWTLVDNWLTVVDFKSGFMPVSATGSLQMIIYALGVLNNFEWDDSLQVSTVIVQPRLKTVTDNWMLTGAELREWQAVLHNRAATAVLYPDVRITGSHCTFCPGAHLCPEFASVKYQALRTVLDPEQRLNVNETLTVMAPTIRAAITGAVKKTVDDSEYVHVPRVTRLRWTKDGKERIAREFGSRVMTDGKVQSPRFVARKLRLSAEVLADLTAASVQNGQPIAKVDNVD